MNQDNNQHLFYKDYYDLQDDPKFPCVTNAKVYNLSSSIIGAKYPMSVDPSVLTDELTKGIESLWSSQKGEGHDQSLTGVIVSFDLTFTIKAWTEAERYHFLDFVSSQSTMHRLARFDYNSCYSEYVDPRTIDVMKDLLAKYKSLPDGTEEKKEAYLKLLYSNPCGMKLTAKMVTNYRQLKTIYNQRKNHRLPEWREFCKWIETYLPCIEYSLKKEYEEAIKENKAAQKEELK